MKCKDKKRFNTIEEATKFAQHYNKKHKTRKANRAYKCKECGKYHTSSMSRSRYNFKESVYSISQDLKRREQYEREIKERFKL